MRRSVGGRPAPRRGRLLLAGVGFIAWLAGGCGTREEGGDRGTPEVGAPEAGAPEAGAAGAGSAEAGVPGSGTLEGFVEVERARLYYRVVGEGDPVLVVHGGPGMDHTYLLPGMESVAEHGLRLILYDQRALGRSTGGPDSAYVSLDGFLRDLDAVRRDLGLGRATLLGHSWGGLLALLYAARYPEAVGALILLNPVEPGRRYQAQAAARLAARRTSRDSSTLDSLFRSPGFARLDPEAVNRIFRITLRSTFADTSRIRDLRIDFGERTARNGARVAALIMGPLGAYDFWEEAGGVQAPTLLIHGEADPIPLEMSRELAARIPHARLVVLRGAGHFPFVEQPERLGSEIRAFLDGLE